MHEHREKRGEMLPSMTSNPRELIERDQIFFSFEAEEPLLEVCVEQLGPEPVAVRVGLSALGQRFPGHRRGVPRDGRSSRTAATAQLLGDNAARFYRL